MNCHYCGAPLNDNEIFCLHCGTRQAVKPEEAPVAAAVTAEVPVQPAVEAAPAPRSATVYKEKTFDWHPYGAPAKEEPLVDFQNSPFTQAPKLQLPVKRKLWKMILFGILTLGIYPAVIWSRLTSEVNLVASRYDGERSMPFFAMALLAPLTLGIHSLVWMHKLCRRIGMELQRRSIPYTFGPSDFWLWAFLLSCIYSICIGICSALLSIHFDVYIVIWLLVVVAVLALAGPFVFLAKLMKAMNQLNADYNTNG